MEELEEMKAQMALLKQQLEKETIVNDHLLREVTRQKVRHINRNVWQEGIAAAFVITFGSYAFYHLHCSIYFIVFTILMMLACFLATLIPHRWVKIDEIMSGDLLSVAKQVSRLRKLYGDWLRIGIPLVILWGLWFCLELFLHQDNWHIALATSVGCICGGIGGGIIGWRMHKRLVLEMDEIVENIEHIQ